MKATRITAAIVISAIALANAAPCGLNVKGATQKAPMAFPEPDLASTGLQMQHAGAFSVPGHSSNAADYVGPGDAQNGLPLHERGLEDTGASGIMLSKRDTDTVWSVMSSPLTFSSEPYPGAHQLVDDASYAATEENEASFRFKVLKYLAKVWQASRKQGARAGNVVMRFWNWLKAQVTSSPGEGGWRIKNLEEIEDRPRMLIQDWVDSQGGHDALITDGNVDDDVASQFGGTWTPDGKEYAPEMVQIHTDRPNAFTAYAVRAPSPDLPPAMTPMRAPLPEEYARRPAPNGHDGAGPGNPHRAGATRFSVGGDNLYPVVKGKAPAPHFSSVVTGNVREPEAVYRAPAAALPLYQPAATRNPAPVLQMAQVEVAPRVPQENPGAVPVQSRNPFLPGYVQMPQNPIQQDPQAVPVQSRNPFLPGYVQLPTPNEQNNRPERNRNPFSEGYEPSVASAPQERRGGRNRNPFSADYEPSVASGSEGRNGQRAWYENDQWR